MQVRQRRRIHYGKGSVFEPAFENVHLRIHAGSMGVGAIRRIVCDRTAAQRLTLCIRANDSFYCYQHADYKK